MTEQPEDDLTEESLERLTSAYAVHLATRGPSQRLLDDLEVITKYRAAITALTGLAVAAAHSEDSVSSGG